MQNLCPSRKELTVQQQETDSQKVIDAVIMVCTRKGGGKERRNWRSGLGRFHARGDFGLSLKNVHPVDKEAMSFLGKPVVLTL